MFYVAWDALEKLGGNTCARGASPLSRPVENAGTVPRAFDRRGPPSAGYRDRSGDRRCCAQTRTGYEVIASRGLCNGRVVQRAGNWDLRLVESFLGIFGWLVAR